MLRWQGGREGGVKNSPKYADVILYGLLAILLLLCHKIRSIMFLPMNMRKLVKKKPIHTQVMTGTF